jgi:heat shock protein HtpX
MDVGRLRLRLSLFCRSLVALGVLATFTLVVAAIVALIGGVFGGILLIYSALSVELLTAAPRLSTVLPVTPAVVAVASVGGLLGLPAGALGVSISSERGFSDRFPRAAAAALLVWFGCLYLALVETSVLLSGIDLAAIDADLVFYIVAVLTVLTTVWAARHEVDQLRNRLVDGSLPATERRPALAETTSRLAQQVDIPSPTLRITETERPESFTVGHGSDAVIVVSTGLVERLTDEEVTAVVAHEVSHLANADSRLMGLVLVPVLMADGMIDDDPGDLGDYVWNAGIWVLKLYGQFGVAILSRGRELAADAGGVALTGSPAALASALATLSEQRQTPTADPREWEQSVGALDILPPSDREHATGPFRTHPSTQKRIERLQQQVAAAERV